MGKGRKRPHRPIQDEGADQAPSVHHQNSGTAVPRKTHPTMPFFDVSAGQ